MPAPQRPFASRHRLLSGAAIVCLHLAALFALSRNGMHGAPALPPPVYAQLLLLQPAQPKPATAPPPPSATPAVRPDRIARRDRPAQPAVRVPPAEPVPAIAQAAVHPGAPADPVVQAQDSTAAPSEQLDVAALVAAAGANERARTKEPLERLRNSQRVRAMNDSDAARGIARAGRADCTKKYSGGTSLDPLRLIPLLYDTLTDTGCKW